MDDGLNALWIKLFLFSKRELRGGADARPIWAPGSRPLSGRSKTSLKTNKL
jgi:hypothetical protein